MACVKVQSQRCSVDKIHTGENQINYRDNKNVEMFENSFLSYL